MTFDHLQAFESLTGERSEVVEQILGTLLFAADIWNSPRVSDGVVSCRAIRRSPTAIEVCGRIWEIEQTQHRYWLAIALHAGGARWTLWYGQPDAGRRAVDAVDAIDTPEDADWRVTLSGTATVQGERLVDPIVET